MDNELIEIAVDMADDIVSSSDSRENVIENYNYHMAICQNLAHHIGNEFTPQYFADKTIHQGLTMANVTIKVKCKVSWWVMPYLKGCALFARLFNQTPNTEKIVATALKGVSVRAEGEVIRDD